MIIEVTINSEEIKVEQIYQYDKTSTFIFKNTPTVKFGIPESAFYNGLINIIMIVYDDDGESIKNQEIVMSLPSSMTVMKFFDEIPSECMLYYYN